MNTNSFESGEGSYRLGDFVATLFRHKKKAVLLPLCIFAMGTLVLLFAPRTYRSEAKLFMQVGRESVNLDPTATTGDTISLQSSGRVNEIVTAIDMLRSRGVIEGVVDRLGEDVVLGKGGVGDDTSNFFSDFVSNTVGRLVQLVRSIDPISDREKAIITIGRNLNVQAEHNSTLIAVGYDAKTPELAQRVAQTLVEVYRLEHLRIHQTSGSKAFFEQQHASLSEHLDQTVNKLREAKNRMHIVSIGSRRGSLENRLSAIENSRYESLQQRSASLAQIADMKKQLSAVPERMVSMEVTLPNTGTDLLRSQLYDLQVLMLDQEAKFAEDHPSLQATRKQLKKAEAMLAKEDPARHETTSDVNPNHRSISLSLAVEESSLAGIEARVAKLDEHRELVLAQMNELNDYEIEIDSLQRATQMAQTDFFRSAENLEKARTDQELDNERISNVIVAQASTLSKKPVNPNKLLVGALTLILAFASTISMVFLCEKLNENIYTEQQLEESLQLPVLGTIPNKRSYAKVSA